MGKGMIDNPALADLQKVFPLQNTKGMPNGLSIDGGDSGCLFIDGWDAPRIADVILPLRIPASIPESWPRYPEHESRKDTERRFRMLEPWIDKANVLDFGAGHGAFSDRIAIQSNIWEIDAGDYEKDRGLVMEEIDSGSLDLVCMFQVFEHLEGPLAMLNEAKRVLAQGGRIAIETPNARDWLLHNCEAFREFTLTPKHLILHSRESLRRFLEHVGFRNIKIQGIQRYGLANHLCWLLNGKPGGHADWLEWIDDDLDRHYAARLAALDATDTLWAVAEK